MMNCLYKFGLIAIGSALLAGWEANPVQAAYFQFSLESDTSDENSGELSFQGSNLTGVGRETTSLNELNEYYQENSESSKPPLFYLNYSTIPPFFDTYKVDLSYDGNAEFIFQSGELVGIKQENASRSDFYSVDGRYGSIYSFDGYVELSLLGDVNEVRLVGEVTESYLEDIYDPVADDYSLEYVDTTYPTEFTTFSGAIEFTTIAPVTSAEEVPEPLTLLGTGTALGFGIYFKRKQKKTKSCAHR